QYPPVYQRPAEADAIVVLSAGIRPPNEIRQVAVLSESGVYRCIKAAQLYHSGAPCKVVLTGGRVDPNRLGPTLADAMSDLMVELGVNRKDLILETHSQSTYENAVKSAELLKQQGIKSIALVTDATHLSRSVRCFEKQGLLVKGCGCQYRATSFQWKLFNFLPAAGAARYNQAVVHEWLGIVWYWIHDRI
ncbi:MAG: YdcF family protein, partial [Planctomycetales bacterium]